MLQLKTGQFHGQTNTTIHLEGLTLTDTEYTLDKVDWHYHENAYFTFILEGKVLEGNKKEVIHCTPGTLLFHNWQEPHYNIKPRGFTRGFHIEVQKNWLDALGFSPDSLQGSINVHNPDAKLLLYKIFRESKSGDHLDSLAVNDMLLNLLIQMNGDEKMASRKPPQWVNKVQQLLKDRIAKTPTLLELSKLLDIHPVHLCRDFPKYFHCTLGNYYRKKKIEKSLSLLLQKNLPLSAIAFECGFADQSHFTRSFKMLMQITPLEYRRHLIC